MTEYVTPNIHSVLKKYQTSAPKSLQGPGHALAAAAAAAAAATTTTTVTVNCGALDATLSGSDAGVGVGVVVVRAQSPCALPLTNGKCQVSEITANTQTHPQQQSQSHSQTQSQSQQPPPAAVHLIKKEILSSPEPHDLQTEATLTAIPLTASNAVPANTQIYAAPPPPELSQPILSMADSGSGELYETRLEGKTIGCFSLGGEMRLCLPQFLNNVLADFTLEQINRIFDELGIYCSQCTPDQLLEFKAAKILPSDVKASGLITRTDAERLCSALLHRPDRNSYVPVESLPKGALSFRVYHKCFGKCEGICTPDMYSFQKPTCIKCLECAGWFSPQKFVGHVHRKFENRTCHWGFDSRNWHDYLHVALDVENREKYQRILDELKEVEIKETMKPQREMDYKKRKAEMLMDDPMLPSPLSQPLPPGLSATVKAPPPSHQALPASLKHRVAAADMLDIPALKKQKSLDEANAYQLDIQRYQSLMYAHCVQQQRVGQMSAFRPWGPSKSFLHAYNATAVAATLSTLPYLSQEPPVLQNPERVVRSTDRERFERTYQPNVALAPRKSILNKEREKEQRELRDRERERERERIERERERELERARQRERSRERDREKERERERELQQQQQMSQSHHHHHHQHQQQQQQQSQSVIETEQLLHIKQERANTPTDMPQTPPLATVGAVNMTPGSVSSNHSNGPTTPMDEDASTMPMISPLSLNMSQHQHSSPSSIELQLQQQQQRRHSLLTSNSSSSQSSSSCSATSPTASLAAVSTSPQHLQPHQHQQQAHHQLSPQQHKPVPAHLPPPPNHVHHQHQHQHHPQPSPLQLTQLHHHHHQHHHPQPIQHQQRQIQHLAMKHVMRQSPTTSPPPSHATLHPHPTNTRSSPEEYSASSNEITSSTSPVPSNNNVHHKQPQPLQQHVIATVNQHAKLLPTAISSSCNSNNNNSSNAHNGGNNNNEMLSRIRINKNLINTTNIMRSPTPPPPTTAAAQPQTFDFYKQQQQQQRHYVQQQHEIYRQHHQQQLQHSPTQSSNSGLNLSTHATNVINSQKLQQQQQQQQQQHQHHNGAKPPHLGSEFELSTDTDDDSINGEPDSSNILQPWEMAVDALRDTRPRDRERILQLLQRLLQENHQYRFNNMQLSELLHKRDAHIMELREQLQHYRLELERVLSMQQQNGDIDGEQHQSKAGDTSTNSCDVDSVGMRLRKTLPVSADDVHDADARDTGDEDDEMEEDDAANDANGDDTDETMTHETSHNNNNNSVVVMNQQQPPNGLRRSHTPLDDCSDNMSNKRLKFSLHEQKHSIDDDGDNDNDNDNGNGDDVEDEQMENSLNTQDAATDSGTEDADPITRSSNSNSNSDSNNSQATKPQNGKIESGISVDILKKTMPQIAAVTAEDSESQSQSRYDAVSGDEAEENSVDATVTDQAKNTEQSDVDDEDEDGDADADREEDEDESNEVDTDSVQTPHTNALAPQPTATTPLSPDSAATAGQLFDSSNSSDESSMKKAQMSASHALAKMSSEETNEDDEENDEHTNQNVLKAQREETAAAPSDEDTGDDDSDVDDDEVPLQQRQQQRKSTPPAAVTAATTTSVATECRVSIQRRNSSSNSQSSSNSNSNSNSSSSSNSSSNNNRYEYQRKERLPNYGSNLPAEKKMPMTLPTLTPTQSRTLTLPTKASKKQTPTTNCELQIKKEIA